MVQTILRSDSTLPTITLQLVPVRHIAVRNIADLLSITKEFNSNKGRKFPAQRTNVSTVVSETAFATGEL